MAVCSADPALTFTGLLSKVDEALSAALDNSAVPFTQARPAHKSASHPTCMTQWDLRFYPAILVVPACSPFC